MSEAGGLFAGGRRVPLTGVAIDVEVRHLGATVSVAQRYINGEDVPVEAIYSFPLPESCGVCGFEVEIGGKRVTGIVEERETAFQRYDDAMEAGQGAFLLDQDRPNIFTASVGNLLPRQEAVVHLAYVTELEQRGDAIRILIPTTISPRYVPPEQLAGMDPAELEHIAPPTVAGPVPYGMRLAVDIATAVPIRAIECPSHAARVEMRGANAARLELSGQDVQLDQDFVATVTLVQAHAAAAVVAHEEDGGRAVMVSFVPDLADLPRCSSEIVFLIDRSGSMGGGSIEQARNALLLCLKSLEAGDFFNIVGFGSSFRMLFPQSVAYSQQTLDEASHHVRSLAADLGGTEIFSALKAVLDAPLRDPLPRQLILLTDGQVGNEKECIDLVARAPGKARVFTFGVGHGVSEHLVRGLARASRGEAELIHPNERIEPKVLRQLSRVTAAHLADVAMDWGALAVTDVTPALAPPLFHGDCLTVYARLTGGSPCEVAITARGPDGPRRFSVFVDPERALRDRTIPTLMARSAIRELEEKSSVPPRDPAMRAKIVALARRYGLASSETSFVAVEQRPAGSQSQAAELRRIPIALTKGWHGGQVARARGIADMVMGSPPAPGGMAVRATFAAFPAAGPPMSPAPMMADLGCFEMEESLEEPPEDRPTPARRPRAARKDRAAPAPVPKAVAPAAEAAAWLDDTFYRMIFGQRANGSWEPGKELLAALGLGAETIDRLAAELSAASEEARILVTTLAVARALRRDFAAHRDMWRLLVEKAERWVAAQAFAPPAGFATLAEWVEARLA
ncbi:MAG: VWA domain-containing protein [Candidatus Schekmanbacteria bacterium]|nr:VWA domain-containing protein [Candidatus Schekmanbacteria bacterium]